MLTRGDHVPHFTVTRLDGCGVPYTGLWQRRHLVLIAIPPQSQAEFAPYAESVARGLATLRPADVECVATAQTIDGMPAPGVLIADRWGEIAAVFDGAVEPLPDPDALVEWVEHVRMACPECEGEAR
ncbi:MAG TPA: hypothetical protein VM364_05780 [Vicinamibacterales bacterium]|nr:hypothetical protein [Vicinamibacterales bacterium]